MKITLTLKSVYGVTRAYPACQASETFARMLNAKTLTRDALTHIKALGYEIEAKDGANLEDVQCAPPRNATPPKRPSARLLRAPRVRFHEMKNPTRKRASP